jgi:HEAT repeat protein
VLEAGLRNDDRDTRWHAFSAIADLNRRETFDLLLRGLKDADHWIRHTAVFAVKSMAVHPDYRDRAVAALVEMLHKERDSWNNALVAAWTLVDLGIEIDPRRFTDALKKERLDHRVCALALEKLKCKEAVGLLLDGFELADTWNAWEFSKALTAITGQDLGHHPAPWREWLEAHRAALPPQWT